MAYLVPSLRNHTGVMNVKQRFSLLPAVALLLLLVRFPRQTAAGIQEGLTLCYRSVIPALFPFFAAVSLLVQLGLHRALQPLFAPLMKPLFGMSGAAVLPLVTGLLGGYPTGAKTAAELHRSGVLSKEETERLLGFCNNCGPAFLLGFIGTTVLDDPALGMRLMGIHSTSALLTGVVLCRLFPLKQGISLAVQPLGTTASPAQALPQAVSSAMGSILQICSYVVLFRPLATAVAGAAPSWAVGILEMVSGISLLSRDSFVAAAAIAAWGGLCVHCQTMAVTEGLSLRYHWMGKTLQTMISVGLAMSVG